MSKIAAIVGRFLLALIFIFSGAGKLMDVAGTEAMITGVGLAGGLAIPVGIFELVAGLCLAAGFMVRLVAVLLAVFTVLTIIFFHNQLGDPMQQVMVLKNLAIIGGLALAFAHSQMWSHYYAISRERRGEVAARSAQERVHEAELRAARAEARAEALGHDRDDVSHHEYQREGAVDTDDDGVPDTRRRRRWFDW
ncbi:DoxX family protein [Novosphingobium malaysiense]|uniref:Membrane protein n=1 Tax=Novosphingobium malaysiense TaxID=1348853 RepID=A0A0B1ZFM9_9SPHN|nr:DoxX family protein [Novosphingobium malaysiense]KHK89320.1 membrane protein [Novosphingobium malaysiense]